MTEERKNISGSKTFLSHLGKGCMIVVFLLSFLAGYNGVSVQQTRCYAQANNDNNDDVRDEIVDYNDPLDYTMIPGYQCGGLGVSYTPPYDLEFSYGTSWDSGTVNACITGFYSCAPPGQAAIVANGLYASLLGLLTVAADQLESKFSKAVDQVTQAFLERINQTEIKLMAWWDALWFYNWRPALQDMTAQMNTALTDQSQTYQIAMDAKQANEANKQIIDNEIKDHEEVRVNENGCPAATVVGGVGRATGIGRAMRGAWQNRSQMVGGNKIGSPGAGGKAPYNKYRNEVYENMFCDPDDNGGANVCSTNPPPPEFHNADTQVSKFILDKLTIPQTGPNSDKFQAAVEVGIENLVGAPASDPIKKDALSTPQGQEKFLQRRAFIARHTAISSVPYAIAAARMPGSKMGKWVSALREDGGVDADPTVADNTLPENPFEHDPPLMSDEISSNPSYREIIHAITIDRFNSGKYAMNNIEDQNAVEMEKLTLEAFYLIQLRDYYELLERTALTLAVQISILADNIAMPPIAEMPKRN